MNKKVRIETTELKIQITYIHVNNLYVYYVHHYTFPTRKSYLVKVVLVYKTQKKYFDISRILV